MWGIDRLGSSEFQGTRARLRRGACAALTHDAAIGHGGRRLLETLEALGAHPRVLFSPEHGLDGVAQAEEPVPGHAASGGPPVVSLYGTSRDSLAPSADALEGVELLVVDLVDVGARFYTYVWTALIAARQAADRGIHTLVLDRPNPLGGQTTSVEGKPQRREFCSFVGLESVPIRHSVTLGEMLAVCFERDGRPLGPSGALSIVPCLGWERGRDARGWGRPFVPPSPNMPSFETALLYPGGCLLEGTNLSEARGTAFPFRAAGAPFLDGEALARELLARDLPGVLVRPVAFRPSFEKHAGSVCHGVMLHVTDAARFRPVRTFLELIALARAQAPEQFRFLDRVYEFESEVPAFDLLCGTDEIRAALNSGVALDDIVHTLCSIGDEDREFPLRAEAVALGAHAE